MRKIISLKNRVLAKVVVLGVSLAWSTASVGLAAAPAKPSQTPSGYDKQVPVTPVERMDSIPDAFKLRDWNQVARDYVHFVFDMDAKGEFLPLCWWDKARRNFDEDTFGTYVVVNEGRGGPKNHDGEFHEALNDLSAIRSGLLAGVDMRKLYGKDYVRMARAYFNRANGRNVFMDYTSERVMNLGGNYGRSFWMDIMPTLYFAQILALCSEDPELSGLLRTSADQFCAAVEIMKKTPEGFDWSTFNFKTMTPIVVRGVPKQPDSAGGFAYVGYLAHQKFGEAKYLAMAKDSLDYLNSQTNNPLQETLLPYGAFAAARMNAEQGTAYDMPKLVNWCFLGGRRTIGGVMYGKDAKRCGYSLEGLVVDTAARVYLYETHELAASMVPLVRYDQRFARAIGKWMLNAASNARLFYPQEIPDEFQDTPQFKEFSRNLIAYEKLQRAWMDPAKTVRGFKADRDTWGDMWHPVSHLSLYSSSAVGTFGSIIRRTSDEKILQLDCLATDFYRNKAYPTFLYYNPYTTEKTVEIDAGASPVDLYDIVGKRMVAQGVSGIKVALTLAADSAAVIVRIPAGTKLERRDGKLYAGDTVVDFHDLQGQDGVTAVAMPAAACLPPTSIAVEPAVPVRPVAPKVPLQAEPFDLREVQLLDGPFKHAQDLNLKLLKEMEFDKLVHSFRRVAGIPSPVDPKWWMFGIDNQHTCGHWLSAAAMHIRNTGDPELKQKADAVVAVIAECQAKIGTGYISGFPEESLLVNEGLVKNNRGASVPWYHLHKVYAGLLDMYELAGNQQALQVLRKTADWVEKNTDQLSDAKMQGMLGTEHGGIAEVLANLYAATGEERYLKLARRFVHRDAIVPPAKGVDRLDGTHANTAVPKFSSVARLHELTGDPEYRSAAVNFWKFVAEERSYVTGGNCYAEFFTPKPYLSHFLGGRTIESCNEYNMLKLTRHLFRETPEPGYADYFERTLYNNVLAVRHPENASLTYYLPMQSGNRKGDMARKSRHLGWRFPLTPPSVDAAKFGGEGACCAGTGMESNARYQDGIYYHAGDRELYVNLFIPSVLNWKQKGITLRQETKFPEESATRLVFECQTPTAMKLQVRRPWWATQDFQVLVNGQKQEVASKPGSYAQVERTWKSGDRVEVVMPQSFYLEGFKDNPKRVALMYGPLVMAAETEYGNIWSLLVAENQEFLKAIKPVAGKPLEFTAQPEVFRTSLPAVKEKPVLFRPLLTTLDNPYAVYWDMMSPAEFEKEAGRVLAERKRQQELEPRTVDLVLCKDTLDESFTVQEYFLTQPGWLARPADQVSEKAHGMKAQKGPQRISPRGRWVLSEMFYGVVGACRILEAGDAVTYQMAVRPGQAQAVSVRIWKSWYAALNIPAKPGTLEVCIGDRVLGRWDAGELPCQEFSDASFPLPEDVVKGKDKVEITLRVPADSTPVCSVYELRISSY